MKRGCLIVAILVLSLMAYAKSAGAKGNILIVKEPSSLKWSQAAQTVNLPDRDLNADGKKEKIRLSVLMGGSANLDTIKVYDVGGKLIFKADYSSDGGCAIGNILGGPKQQIAFWRMVWQESESHAGSHFYNVIVYDWNAKGKLAEAYFYRTIQKYGSGSPWPEFLKNQSQWVYIKDLVAIKPAAADLQKVLKLGLKQNSRMKTIQSVAQIGPWLMVGRYHDVPTSTDWDGQIEVWRKVKGQWVNLSCSVMSTDEVQADELRMPFSLLQKLNTYYCKHQPRL